MDCGIVIPAPNFMFYFQKEQWIIELFKCNTEIYQHCSEFERCQLVKCIISTIKHFQNDIYRSILSHHAQNWTTPELLQMRMNELFERYLTITEMRIRRPTRSELRFYAQISNQKLNQFAPTKLTIREVFHRQSQMCRPQLAWSANPATFSRCTALCLATTRRIFNRWHFGDYAKIFNENAELLQNSLLSVVNN